jgi:hypothetical protein
MSNVKIWFGLVERRNFKERVKEVGMEREGI